MVTMSSNGYQRWLYALIVMLVVIAGIYLSGWFYGILRALANILALYFAAWLLQFFLMPIVNFLTRHGLPRLLAVTYVFVVLFLIFVVVMIAIVPPIVSQVQSLVRQAADPHTYTVITNATKGIENFLRDHGVPKKDIDNFTKQWGIQGNLQKGVITIGQQTAANISRFISINNIQSGVTTAVQIIQALSNFLINLVIILILTFYMLLDGARLMQRFLAYFPPVVSEVMAEVQVIINRKFGGYLRGQLILAACYGVLTFGIVQFFGLQYALFMSIFAAVMMLIPFIGTYAAIAPPLILFAVQNSLDFPLGRFLVLLLLLILSQQIVINFLSPRVMGGAVGIHPLLIVFGLLLSVKLAGLWGAIFGVPIFGVILDTIDIIYRRVMESRFGFRPPVDGVSAQAPPPAAEPAREMPSGDETAARPLARAGATLHLPSPPSDTKA